MAGSVDNGGRGAGGVPARPVPGQSTIIASELGGDLPCLRCKYNLKGLSIRTVCPECATPVRATLLAVVDPMASELRPIPHPLLTATGVVTWSTSALAAAFCAWAMRLLGLLSDEPMAQRVVQGLGVGLVLLTVLSGLGALAIIKPHDGIKVRHRRFALVACLAYVPLALALWWLYVDMAPPPLSIDAWRDVSPARSELGVLACGLMIAITIGLRPNARLLAARSLLMRTGRVDRQTMLALVGVLCVSMAGHALVLLGGQFYESIGQSLHLIGQVLVLVSGVLFTIGLVGVAIDCWRMRPVIVESPVSLSAILAEPLSPPPAAIPHPPAP
jgi:hypothetical protein